MKRLSRHTVVVVIIAMLSSMCGMGLAVVAFGQDAQSSDATVPLGDYTATTPATTTRPSTTTLSGYTVTAPSTVETKTSTSPAQASPSRTTGGSNSTHSHGRTARPSSGGTQPSQATRPGPTRLAFTGGEPVLLGAAGFVLMLAGLTLHLRRRRRAPHLPV
jgi:hypothetical protein